MRSLITFDFHNTLATCDPWFLMEIRDLPVEVLRDIDPPAAERAGENQLRTAYRALRQRVVASGREVDALTSVALVFDGLGMRYDQDTLAASIERVMRRTLAHAAPVAGAIETVRALAATGHVVGVVSSAVYHPFLQWTLEAFELTPTLAFVMTSASSGYYKSDPEIYRQAMAMAGVSSHRSVHVGDSLRWDVGSARRAGMRTVWFRNGHADVFGTADDGTVPDMTLDTLVGAAPRILETLGR